MCLLGSVKIRALQWALLLTVCVCVRARVRGPRRSPILYNGQRRSISVSFTGRRERGWEGGGGAEKEAGNKDGRRPKGVPRGRRLRACPDCCCTRVCPEATSTRRCKHVPAAGTQTRKDRLPRRRRRQSRHYVRNCVQHTAHESRQQ